MLYNDGIAIGYWTTSYGNSSDPELDTLKPTLKWFKENGYPFPDDKMVYIFTMDRFNWKDEDFEEHKEKSLITMKGMGEVITGIDDQPYATQILYRHNVPVLTPARFKDKRTGYPPNTLFYESWDNVPWIIRGVKLCRHSIKS